MHPAAHISRTHDGSLKHRISEYFSALSAYDHIQASKDYIQSPDLENTMGHKDDIQIAEKILTQSVTQLSQSLSNNDLELALTHKLINSQDLKRLSQIKVGKDLQQTASLSSGAKRRR